MSGELQNIPFYWTALSHWVSCVMLILCLPRRLSGWRTGVFWAVLLMIQQGYMWFTEPQDGLVFNLLMLGFALICLGAVFSLYRVSLRKALYFTARTFLTAGFTVSLAWQIYIFVLRKIRVPEGEAAQIALQVLIVGGVLLACCVIFCAGEAAIAVTDRNMSIRWPVSIAGVIVGFAVYILSSISFAPLETPFTARTYEEAFRMRSLIYFAGVSMLTAAHYQICDAWVRRERDALQNTLDMQLNNYRIEQASVELVNRKYHDLKHQIEVLRSSVEKDVKLDYLDRLEQEIRIYETTNKTGNQILDTILTGKSIECQQQHIELTAVADGGAIDFMDMADISVLFGNALDNAIEAVSAIPRNEERLIHLSVSRHKGFARILVENRFQGKLRLRDNLPATTKHDASNHGYGVRSIRAIAEKYGGSVTFTGNEGWFEVRILLPMPKDRQDAQAQGSREG